MLSIITQLRYRRYRLIDSRIYIYIWKTIHQYFYTKNQIINLNIYSNVTVNVLFSQTNILERLICSVKKNELYGLNRNKLVFTFTYGTLEDNMCSLFDLFSYVISYL